jgi:hypothetical protein
MDVTNPGLVNVADQVAGNPSTSVDSVLVPRQDDDLENVADDGYPRAEDVSLALDAGTSTFPTPVEVSVGNEAPAALPQDYGQVPGTAPVYAPTPQTNLVDTVIQQQVAGVGTTEILVGPDSNIQVNINSESERCYIVTSVLDADTGGPVVDPLLPTTGTFNAIFDGGSGSLVVVSPSPFPPEIVDGIIVGVKSSSGASYDTHGTISGVTSLSGTLSTVNASTGGKVTVCSPTNLPAGLVDGRPVILATTVPNYNGAKAVSGVVSVAGTFAKVATFDGGGKIMVISPTVVPSGLAAGKLATVSGGVYSGTFPVDSVWSAQGGSFDTAANNGSGGTTFHSTSPLPPEVDVGQSLIISGAVYSGTYVVTGVNAGADTFDLAVPFTETDAGTWMQSGNYAFILTTTYVSDDSGTWTCYTFDVTSSFMGPATCTWTSYTFNIPGTYTATAAGSWTFIPSANITTRYRLGVSSADGSPADLRSFGISLLDREIVFSSTTATVADRGACRLINYYGAAYVIIEKSDPDDSSVPVMACPTAGPPGDAFTLFVQRESSEVFTDLAGQVTDVVIDPPPPPFEPDNFPSQSNQGDVNVTVGSQPGNPVLTSGVLVPTARNVSVADQSLTVGLPRNIYV